jgi:hypothetical protein
LTYALVWMFGITATLFADVDSMAIVPRLAVLEMHNRSDYRGHMVSRRTAESLAQSFQSIGRWDIVEQAEVRRVCREMDLQPPFAVGYQQALGHRLGADLILNGYVEEVRISPDDGAVSVQLVLDIVDRICGQSVGSVQVHGSARRVDSNPRPTDFIFDEALTSACRQAAELAAKVPGYSATVVSVSANTVVLDTSLPLVATVGDRLLLYRQAAESAGHKLVGALMVTTVDETQLQTAIMGKASELYSGDEAVCVGPMRLQP